eukprot:bmy_04349T0
MEKSSQPTGHQILLQSSPIRQLPKNTLRRATITRHSLNNPYSGSPASSSACSVFDAFPPH